jgi:uncharacterized protein
MLQNGFSRKPPRTGAGINPGYFAEISQDVSTGTPPVDRDWDFYRNEARSVIEPHGEPLFVYAGGSIAYGLDHAESDVDLRGFYRAPNDEFLGMFKPNEGVTAKTANETDVAFHELGKFFQLASASNPQVIEAIFVETDGLINSPEAALIRKHKGEFLASNARFRYIAFAKTELAKLERRMDEYTPEKRAKVQRHYARLTDNCEEILTDRNLTVRVNRERIWAYGEMPFDTFKVWAEKRAAELEVMPTSLPERTDRDALNRILLQIRNG